MPEKDPISMFCGLPVMVATLPMFELVATASKYGSGGKFIRLVMLSKKGTMTRHTMSFTKNAERIPQVKITAGKRYCAGSLFKKTSALHSKNPTKCRFPTIIIMDKSTHIVVKWIKCRDSDGT